MIRSMSDGSVVVVWMRTSSPSMMRLERLGCRCEEWKRPSRWTVGCWSVWLVLGGADGDGLGFRLMVSVARGGSVIFFKP